MKISVLQENLAKGLSIVSRAVSTRSTLPVLGNVLLQTDEGRLKLSATNLEVVITCWVGAKVEEAGAITVPARTLVDLVGALPAEQVNLELNVPTQTLHVSCARTETNIKGIDAQEFPLVPEVGDNERIPVPADTLKEMIRQVTFAAANDDSRPVLTGVLTKFDGKQMSMAATDAFRLSIQTADIETSVEAADIIIPAKALKEVQRVIADDAETVNMSLPEGRNQVIFEMDNVLIVSQLLEGNFPDFSPVVPTSYRTRTVMGRADFLKACKTADIFAREASNTARLHIVPGDDGQPAFTSITATSSETGDNKAQIDASVEGDPIEIAFNVKYMQEVLNVIDTPQVALETESPTHPGVIKPVGKEGYIHIIMPMQFGR